MVVRRRLIRKSTGFSEPFSEECGVNVFQGGMAVCELKLHHLQ